jgi:uncharacterized protein HemY
VSDGDVRAWWLTLAAGLVVALVVTALLEWLRRTVLDVERGVDAIWTSGKRVAQNTQTTHVLQTTKARGLGLREEVERHREMVDGGGTA